MFGLTLTQTVMMICGAAFLLVWLLLYLRGLQYGKMFAPLDEKEYPLKDLYGIGYAIVQLLHISFKRPSDRKLRKDLSVLYGEKYCEYYLHVVYAQKYTMAFSLLVLAFAFYGLAQDMLAFAVFVMFAGLAFYYYGTLPEKKIAERSEVLLRDFPEIVANLALLTNAGMILREAWQATAAGGSSEIYKEMKLTVDEMQNGVPEVDAIFNFGSRCIIPEVKKFSATIIQGLTKGNSELSLMLQLQSKEVWQLKKQLVRRAAEKAASKLLLPLCAMFLGVIIMIVVPIFANIGV